jgi:hypothetical protein
VYWPENTECYASFESIFKGQVDLIGDAEFLHLLAKPDVTTRIFNSGYKQPFEVDALVDSEHDVIVVKPWFIPLIWGVGYSQDVWSDMRKHWLGLQFRDDLLAQATPSAFATHIGIHVRYGDPHPDGSVNQLESYAASSVAAFKRTMRLFVARYPTVRFYVASPMAWIKEDLSQEFPCDSIVTDPFRTPQGIRDAITDMHNLAGCALILGSGFSQFTRFISLMTGRPFGIVYNDHYELEYCHTTGVTLAELFARYRTALNDRSSTSVP